MFSSKGCYKRINKIHERSLRLILNDYESSFNSFFPSSVKKHDSSKLPKLFTDQIIQIFKPLLS